jgi:energy-coupling factor transporter ATP-binding protein EcfA2
MKVLAFRVQNFRNIDDSGWIPLEQVTAFVGRNESGKTTLLKAFHKFNPATSEPYDPQREFPRDRYTRDFVAGGSKSSDWPVCSVRFALPDDLRLEIAPLLRESQEPPQNAILTRHYDGSLSCEYEPRLQERLLSAEPIITALAKFASAARRLGTPAPEQEDAIKAQRVALADWPLRGRRSSEASLICGTRMAQSFSVTCTQRQRARAALTLPV